MAYNELEQRGTADFPVAYFCIDEIHPRYHMSAHWHNEVELVRVVSGSMKITLNSHMYIAKQGDVLFINPETVHRAIPDKCVYECMVFHANFLYNDTYACRSFIENILNRDYLVNEYIPFEDSEFHECAKRLFCAVKKKEVGNKFRIISAFYDLFGVIEERRMYFPVSGERENTSDKSILRLKKCLSFIRENFDKQITLSDMAKNADMSAKYFGTFFKNMTEKTPMEYLNEYRIEKASRKLLYTDASVTDVAFSCGFNDLSYFIKTFKKIHKISPGQYRKK